MAVNFRHGIGAVMMITQTVSGVRAPQAATQAVFLQAGHSRLKPMESQQATPQSGLGATNEVDGASDVRTKVDSMSKEDLIKLVTKSTKKQKGSFSWLISVRF